MRRTVQDVMTRDVVVARESTSFHELVELLSRRHVSALPVVDDRDHVVGIVSESDLLLKEVEELKARCDPLELTLRHRQERFKAAGTTAVQLMAEPAVTAHPEEPVTEVARRMHARKVNQLPVVDRGGVLVGIVARADLLKVFLRPDQEIRFELLDDVIGRLLGLPASGLDIQVDGGVVTLAGGLARRSQVVALTELAQALDGVVAVRSRLTFERDDLTPDQVVGQPAP